MTTEADALVRELEDQRAFGFTRAAKYAARIASLEIVLAAKEKDNGDLRRENADLKADLTRLNADKEAAKVIEHEPDTHATDSPL